MTPVPLPEDAPSRRGTDADGISAFLDATAHLEQHSLMILRHGHVIASGWWEPYGPGRQHHLYSLSKSFTSTAAGLAVAEGLLDLDAPVVSYFPELDADVTDPRSRAMLVRHIASMASGHRTDTWGAVRATDPEQPVRAFLRIPPVADPGTVFCYNQPCTYTLATIVQRVTGQPLTEYLRPRLFDPVGIGAASWTESPPGQALGFIGLHVTTDAIARLGELYLRGGQWQGRQVVPREWVAEATRPQIDTQGWGENPDWQQGYGFQFWRARHGYRGDGAFGQFCLVLPEHDAVIAMTSGTEDMQGILDAVWTHVLPAFSSPGSPASPGSPEADAALAKRLAGLRLPARGERLAQDGPWPNAPVVLAPEGGTCEALPVLRQVRLKGRDLVLSDGTVSVELSVPGGGGWHVTEAPVPAAASGGWTATGTLEIDVIFLETPHRLTLTCQAGEGTFRARWATAPLGRVESLSSLGPCGVLGPGLAAT